MSLRQEEDDRSRYFFYATCLSYLNKLYLIKLFDLKSKKIDLIKKKDTSFDGCFTQKFLIDSTEGGNLDLCALSHF